MFATWILCLFLLMIAPYLTLEAGILRKKKCAALGAGRGYRTELSMASQEAWDYAQQICSKRYMIAGILMAVAALLFIRVAPTDTPCKPVCVHRRHRVVRGCHGHSAVASVETSLRKRFVPKAAACLSFSSFLSP